MSHKNKSVKVLWDGTYGFFVPIQEESENIIISPQKIGFTKPDGFDLYGAFLYHARWAEMSVSYLLFWNGGVGIRILRYGKGPF